MKKALIPSWQWGFVCEGDLAPRGSVAKAKMVLPRLAKAIAHPRDPTQGSGSQLLMTKGMQMRKGMIKSDKTMHLPCSITRALHLEGLS